MTTSIKWPEPRIVATLPGSLPDGGVVPDTPIFTFSSPIDDLILVGEDHCKITKTEIDLGPGLLAFRINNVLNEQQCQRLIEAGEFLGFRSQAPGINTPPGMRQNKTVHWMADHILLDYVYKKIQPLLPKFIGNLALMPQLSHRLNMYKYQQGDVFNDHIDGDWPGFSLDVERKKMIQWNEGRSCLTMLLYLNGSKSGVLGGATRLYGNNNSWHDSSPETGDALFFRHGFVNNSVRHKGCTVISENPKYVVRVNVMYN